MLHLTQTAANICQHADQVDHAIGQQLYLHSIGCGRVEHRQCLVQQDFSMQTLVMSKVQCKQPGTFGTLFFGALLNEQDSQLGGPCCCYPTVYI